MFKQTRGTGACGASSTQSTPRRPSKKIRSTEAGENSPSQHPLLCHHPLAQESVELLTHFKSSGRRTGHIALNFTNLNEQDIRVSS